MTPLQRARRYKMNVERSSHGWWRATVRSLSWSMMVPTSIYNSRCGVFTTVDAAWKAREIALKQLALDLLVDQMRTAA